MPGNVWTAGRDALMDFVARREAEQRMLDDRAAEAEDRRMTQNFREAQLQLQNNQLASLERDRVRDDERAAGAAKAKAAEEGQIQEWIRIVTDPSVPTRAREMAGLELDRRGVDPKRIDSIINPGGAAPETQPVVRVNPRTGKVETIGTVPKGSHFVQEPAPPRAPAAPAAAKDNPLLPNGTKAWLDSISLRVAGDVTKARQELANGWKYQMQAHPRASLAEASRYLDQLFPQGMGLPAPAQGAEAPAAAGSETPNAPPTPAAAPPLSMELPGTMPRGTRLPSVSPRQTMEMSTSLPSTLNAGFVELPAGRAATPSPAAAAPTGMPADLPPGARPIPGIPGAWAVQRDGRWIRVK